MDTAGIENKNWSSLFFRFTIVMNFENKVVLITWASDGLGRATAERFINLWAVVIGIAKTQEKLDALASELWNNFYSFHADLSNKNELNIVYDTIWKQFPVIDVLINNAAIWYEWSVLDHDLDILQSLIMTNIFSVMWSVYKALPRMRKNKSGQILNINSIAGVDGCKDRSPYSGTKFAITWYTKWLGEEAAQYGVKVMQLHPWWMNTNIFESYQPWYGLHDWMMDKERVVDVIITMLSQPEDMIVESVVVRKFTS